jgi:hypothetical protein
MLPSMLLCGMHAEYTHGCVGGRGPAEIDNAALG